MEFAIINRIDLSNNNWGIDFALSPTFLLSSNLPYLHSSWGEKVTNAQIHLGALQLPHRDHFWITE